MTDIEIRVNEIIEILNNSVENVKFIYAFPNTDLTVPLRDSYICSVMFGETKKSQDGVKSENSLYNLELLSPVGFSGKDILLKSKEISDVICDMDFSQKNVSCRIGDITYSKDKRSYSVKLQLEISYSNYNKSSITAGNDTFNALVLSEQIKSLSSDIMVYGMSKPFDTLLECNVYNLKIRAENKFFSINESFSVSYETEYEKITYSNCLINKCTITSVNNSKVYDYDVVSYERSIYSI